MATLTIEEVEALCLAAGAKIAIGFSHARAAHRVYISGAAGMVIGVGETLEDAMRDAWNKYVNNR